MSKKAQVYEIRQDINSIINDFILPIPDLTSIALEAGIYMLNETLFGKPMVEAISKAPNKGSFLGHIYPMAFSDIFILKFGDIFRSEKTKYDKDMVCLVDSKYSFEIKVSTSFEEIRGNNSYAWSEIEKDKSSYYLAINFNPDLYFISMIRFGWLDIEDWTKTTSGQGQGSSVKVNSRRTKMIKLYERN